MPRADRTQPPWMRNERWSTGDIRDQSKEHLLLIWVLALAWNIITALALIPHIGQAIHSESRSWLLALAFPAIGLGLLIWAARCTRRTTKFGESIFRLQTFPAAPGGDLLGTIHVPQEFQPTSPVQLQLACINRYLSGFGRNARVIDRIVWQHKVTLDALPSSADGTDIPVLFHIPPDARPSSDLPFRDGIRWRLEARCKTAGVGYYSRFEVPVFVASPDEIAAASRRDLLLSDTTEPVDPRSKLADPAITIERFASGRVEIFFASARNKPSIILTAIAGAALCAIALRWAVRPEFELNRIISISITSVVLAAGGLLLCRAAFNVFATDEIIVRYGSLTLQRHGPMYFQEQTFKLADVSDIFQDPKDTSPANKNGRYGLVLTTRDGDVIPLAGDIRHHDYAAWLADEIKDTLGVAAQKESK